MTRGEHVLAIPAFYVAVIPDHPPSLIVANKTVLIEEVLPIRGPLTMDVVLPRLAGASGGENDNARMGS